MSYKKHDTSNKKIAKNPKYEHVKAQVDTGASLSAYMHKLEETRRNYKYRKDEIFKRMKVTTFAQLVIQVAFSEDSLTTPQPHSSQLAPVPSLPLQQDDISTPKPPMTARSTLSDLVTGVGQLEVERSPPQSPEATGSPPPPSPQSACPYLLLDVRDKEDYDKCHIIGASHYPSSMLLRSCNYFGKDILSYKNKPGKVIIVYDEDERIAPNVASVFVQKDVENVFMLSGGMRVLYKTFPEGMFSGQIPQSCLPSPPPSARKGSGKKSAQPPNTSRPFVYRDTFTEDDLEAIQAKLDEVLLAAESNTTSRATTQRSTAVASTASGRSSVKTTSDNKPWR